MSPTIMGPARISPWRKTRRHRDACRRRRKGTSSRSLRGTQVAAVFYTLCKTARLAGVDPQAYLLHAVYAAIGRPDAVTFPDALIPATATA